MSGTRPTASQPRLFASAPFFTPSVPAVTATAIGGAFALSLVARSPYLDYMPTRAVWLVAFLTLTLVSTFALRPILSRWFRPRLAGLSSTSRIAFLMTSAAFACGAYLVASWSPRSLLHNIWVHGKTPRDVLIFLLPLADRLVIATAFAGVFGLALGARPSPSPKPGWFRWKYVAVGAVAYLAAENAFAAWYVGAERCLYYWDYAGYWIITSTQSQSFAASIGDGFNRVLTSVAHEDYTLLPTVGPALAVGAFGDDRLTYVLAVTNLYAFAVLLAAVLFLRLVPISTRPDASFWACVAPFVVAASLPALRLPTLRGYLDVGGAALLVAAFALYLSRRPAELPWPRLVAVGVLFALAALFRRWYAFVIVAFFATAFVEVAIAWWRTRSWAAFRPPVAIACTFVAVMLTTSFPLVKRIATTSYAETYLGYHTMRPAVERWLDTLGQLGGATLLLALAGFALLAWRPATRRIALFVGATAAIAFAHFHRVIDPDMHHRFIYLPALMILTSAGLAVVVMGARRAWFPSLGLVAVGVTVNALTFVPSLSEAHAVARPWVPASAAPPFRRGDLDEFRRLLRFIEAETAGEKKFCVLSSSHAFNQTMLITTRESLGEPFAAIYRILPLTEVDYRNSYPANVLVADVVVVADPPQWHLRPEEQQAILIPVASFLDGTDVANAFERLPEAIHLDGGVTVAVYRKVRAIRDDERAAFDARLRAAHPGREGFASPPR